MKTSHLFLPAYLYLPALTALLALAAVSPVAAETRVHLLDSGDVFVDLERCSVVFNRRGDIAASGQSCSRGDLRRARDAYDSYRQEQGGGHAGGFDDWEVTGVPGDNLAIREGPSRQSRVVIDGIRNGQRVRSLGVCEQHAGEAWCRVEYRSRTGWSPQRYLREPGSGHGGSSGSSRGVTLYRDANYRGTSESFDRDIADMRLTRIGNDELSSMRIPRGCRVSVYEDVDYGGRAEDFYGDVPEMSRTGIGNDQASSLRVSCGFRAVTLYRNANYRGTSESFDRDIADMRLSRIGNDELSSMRIPRGCRVTVYEDVDYGGRAEDFNGDVPEMSRTRIGNDRASSLRVSCR